MKKILLFLVLAILSANGVCAQTDANQIVDSTSLITETPTFGSNKAIGFGLGLEYGGIGGNFTYHPTKQLSVFAGFGYALAGMGYNVGTKIHLTGLKPTSTVGLNLIGMYGYNAAVSVSGASDLNKLFYGGTLGLNLDYKPFNHTDYFTFSFLVPLNTKDFDDYREDLEKHAGVTFQNEVLPFRISLGWMFRMI